MSRIKRYILKLLNYAYYRLYLLRGKTESILEKTNDELLYSSWERNDSNCYIQSRKDWTKDNEIALSIVVPLYNSEKFIHRNVDSLLAQKTKYKYEIILVNDGSTDSTQLISEKYRNDNPEKILSIYQ